MQLRRYLFKYSFIFSAVLVLIGGNGIISGSGAHASNYHYGLKNALITRALKKGTIYGSSKRFTLIYHHHRFSITSYPHSGGVIRSLDGNSHSTNSQIIAALKGKASRYFQLHTKKYHTGYFSHGIWHRYQTGYYNRNWRWVSNKSLVRHIHHYHVMIDGIDGGWTNSYRNYKIGQSNLMDALKIVSHQHRMSVKQFAKTYVHRNYSIKSRR